MPPILPPVEGFLFLDKDKFHASFAGDLPEDEARFMADSQVPWGLDALGGNITQPAWRIKPSWYLVASDDRMIPPPVQRSMADRAGATVSEVAASHSLVRLPATRHGRRHRAGRTGVDPSRTEHSPPLNAPS